MHSLEQPVMVVVEGEIEGIDDCAACEMRNRQGLTRKHTRHKVIERPEEWGCKNREDAQDSDILLSSKGEL